MSYSIVGEQILKYRKEKGLTQRELGEAIGVSSSAVSQWESGGTPDISLLPALSDVLGVTVDALFGRCDTRREDIEETVRSTIASLPEEKRLELIVSLLRKTALYGCLDKVAGLVDFHSVQDSAGETVCIAEDGFITAILSGGQSFLSAAWGGDFAGLLSAGREAAGLFGLLSSPNALTMLIRLYGEAPRHRTAGVLAKLAGIERGEAEEILRQFTEHKLAEELTLETEEGDTAAYAVNINGAVIPLLAAARLAAMETEGVRLIADKRGRAKGGK